MKGEQCLYNRSYYKEISTANECKFSRNLRATPKLQAQEE